MTKIPSIGHETLVCMREWGWWGWWGGGGWLHSWLIEFQHSGVTFYFSWYNMRPSSLCIPHIIHIASHPLVKS